MHSEEFSDSDRMTEAVRDGVAVLLEKIKAAGEDPVGWSIVVPVGLTDDGQPAAYIVAGETPGVPERAPGGPLFETFGLLGEAVISQLRMHPQLGMLLPALMVGIAWATGGEMIEADLPIEVLEQDEVPPEFEPDSPARRAAERRRQEG